MNHLKHLLSFLVLLLFIVTSSSCSNSDDVKVRNPYNLDLVTDYKEYNKMVKSNPELKLVKINEVIEPVFLDIKYATQDNFTKEVIYTSPDAFARVKVAEALKKVSDSIASHNLSLKIYDAYRPYAATLKFYEVFPDTNFVANPRFGSRHNRGCAVDLTLVERETGKEIPMPTPFDEFSEKAHPNYSELPDTILKNRQFLFSVMEHFGFTHYPSEWWHFDFTGWENYPLMDISFDELLNY